MDIPRSAASSQMTEAATQHAESLLQHTKYKLGLVVNTHTQKSLPKVKYLIGQFYSNLHYR